MLTSAMISKVQAFLIENGRLPEDSITKGTWCAVTQRYYSAYIWKHGPNLKAADLNRTPMTDIGVHPSIRDQVWDNPADAELDTTDDEEEVDDTDDEEEVDDTDDEEEVEDEDTTPLSPEDDPEA